MSGLLNFNDVESPKENEYLKPGYYKVSPFEAKYVEYQKKDGSPGTPYVEVTFKADEGIVKERYFITAKALERLQYLHENLFGKRLEKAFENEKQVGAYFEKAFASPKAKEIKKTLVVAGERVGDRVFSRLEFSKYFLPDAMEVNLGAFSEDSPLYSRYVVVKQNEATNTNDTIINENTKVEVPSDINDDLPF